MLGAGVGILPYVRAQLFLAIVIIQNDRQLVIRVNEFGTAVGVYAETIVKIDFDIDIRDDIASLCTEAEVANDAVRCFGINEAVNDIRTNRVVAGYIEATGRSAIDNAVKDVLVVQ